METIKILGSTSDFTTCELCGKKHLKKTVALEIDGELVHYGSCCAAKTILGTKKASAKNNIQRLADSVEFAKRKLAEGHDVAYLTDRLFDRCGWVNVRQTDKGIHLSNDAGEVIV